MHRRPVVHPRQRGGVAPGGRVGLAAALCVLDRLSSRRLRGAVRPPGPMDPRELRAGLARGAVRALLPEHVPAGDAGPRVPARDLHACRLRLHGFPLPGIERSVHGRPAPADDHAGSAPGRELPHPRQDRTARHDPRHRAALSGLGLRDLPAAADLQEHSEGARGGGPPRGRQRASDPAARLRARRQADLHRLRARDGELPLEQLSLAAGRHELRRYAARSPSDCRSSRRWSRASTGAS